MASKTLEILKEAGYIPALVVTSPDRPKGRKMIVAPPPVKIWAEKNGVPCLQPEKPDAEFAEKLSSLASGGPAGPAGTWDLFIVVAYGKILPKKILSMPRLGSINIHYSLLPKYRGASPVESAILSGETETGVAIQQMELKMDSGPILAVQKMPIGPDETAPELRERLIKIGGEMLERTLPEIAEGKIKPEPQDESRAVFCGKISKEDGHLDLSDDPVKNYNKFRAYAEWPRTFFFQDGKRIVITKAALSDGKFEIQKVIPEGKKEMAYEVFRKINTSR